MLMHVTQIQGVEFLKQERGIAVLEGVVVSFSDRFYTI
jgi:hypothetical protein